MFFLCFFYVFLCFFMFFYVFLCFAQLFSKVEIIHLFNFQVREVSGFNPRSCDTAASTPYNSSPTQNPISTYLSARAPTPVGRRIGLPGTGDPSRHHHHRLFRMIRPRNRYTPGRPMRQRLHLHHHRTPHSSPPHTAPQKLLEENHRE